MTALYSETFTGANANPIGGNWTTLTSCSAIQRIANAIDGTAGDSGAYVNAVVPPNDQYARMTFGGGAITTDGGPIIRAATGAKTFYLLDLPTTAQLYKCVAGAFTTIGSGIATGMVAGDVFEIRASGTTISGWKNGVQLMSVVDATIASGRFGAFISGTSLRWSTFEGGNLLQAPLVVGRPQAPAFPGVGPNPARIGRQFAFMGSTFITPVPVVTAGLLAIGSSGGGAGGGIRSTGAGSAN